MSEQAELDLAESRAASLRRLHALIRQIKQDLDLETTLRAIAQGVVDGLGFEVAVVNLVEPGGDLVVVAIAGPEEARAALHGQRGRRADWDELLRHCQPVGDLLVEYSGELLEDGVPSWVPDIPTSEDEGAWRPSDELFAPLSTQRSGLLGVISVDLPIDGRRPGSDQLELLEMYAAQASLAVENARLHAEVVARDAERGEALGRLSALVEAAPVAILELDLEGRVRLWNPAAEQIFGWKREEVLGSWNPTVTHDGYAEGLVAMTREGGVSHLQDRRRRKDGSEVDVEVSSDVLRDSEGRPFGYIGVLADVTERLQLERELRVAAFHDALTGLANRALFQAQLHRMADERPVLTLLLLDLDGFKAVNDTHGHGAGDRVLVEVAARLLATCRADDVVARLGGDEFVVLLGNARGEGELADAVGLAERLLQVLARPFDVDGQRASLGASIGVAEHRTGAQLEAVLRDADIAMYAAKAEGKGRFRVFEPQLRSLLVERTELAEDLRQALPSGQFSLRWHPVLELPDRQVVAMEALLRWNHPERGELLPDVFIGLSEELSLIVGIGQWVLEQACRRLRAWQEQVPTAADIAVVVNLSPVQLRQADMVQQVRQALAAGGIEPGRLVLELTESVVLSDVQQAVEVLEELRSLGVRLALDDFGAGYSSLSYLKRLPVDFVKIDRSLVHAVEDEPAGLALLDAVLSLLDRLALRAVVEGIETEGQLDLLQRLGSPLVQGFLFGQPLPDHEVPALLRAGRAARPVSAPSPAPFPAPFPAQWRRSPRS